MSPGCLVLARTLDLAHLLLAVSSAWVASCQHGEGGCNSMRFHRVCHSAVELQGHEFLLAYDC